MFSFFSNFLGNRTKKKFRVNVKPRGFFTVRYDEIHKHAFLFIRLLRDKHVRTPDKLTFPTIQTGLIWTRVPVYVVHVRCMGRQQFANKTVDRSEGRGAISKKIITNSTDDDTSAVQYVWPRIHDNGVFLYLPTQALGGAH